MSVEQFGKALTASQLLTADEVRAAWGAIPATERPKDGEAFAKLLVAQKKLTEFQAKELLAGRGARLMMGEYAVLAEIGAGGMGQVYKAQHRRMKRVVALKVMSNAAMKDEAAVKRFQREVQAAARLEHANIVTAYDSGEAGSVKYLVMQFVDGGDLSDLVKKNGPLSVERACDYVLQAAKGLAFAHGEGVIHRDIKPANLLLVKKGIIKILDMGLARIEGGDDGLTATEQVMGTVDYMSPEQAANTKTADARADIYSLGCTLWYLLSARKVYESDSMIGRLMAHRDAPLPSLVKTRDDVPWALEQAFHKMIAKRPQDRFQSMAEVIAAIEPFAGEGSSGGGSGSGSGVRSNAELASFMNAMGSGPTKAGQSTAQVKSPGSKTSVAAQLDATAQFDKPDAETDPKSQLLTPATGTAARSTAAPRLKTKSAKSGSVTNKAKLIAAAFAGAVLLLVAGIIITVRDKDGNVVAELNVPNGASVEVKPTPAAPTATGISAVEAQRNRAAAEWCLSETGTVLCEIIAASPFALSSSQVRNKSELPREPFYVLRILRDNGNVSSLKSVDGLTRLLELHLKNTRVTDAVLQQLGDLPKLDTLGLAGSLVTDDCLKWAANRYKTLNVLDLRGVGSVTDLGLKHLSQLPNLGHVMLTGTSVTAVGVADLRKARPRCLIDWSATPTTDTSPPMTPSTTDATSGWISLFNGRDFTGWTMVGAKGWTVAAGGVLVGRTSGTNPGWLMSDAEYDDFEFECEYKLGPDGNSGVFYRAWPEGKVNGGDFQEIQLLDDNSPKFANVRSNSRTGAIYGYAAPSPEVRPPAGQWHKLHFAVFRTSARISINGTQVVATELADGKRSSGRIGLQLHSDEVSFRNVRLRPLKPDGTPRTLPSTPQAGAVRRYPTGEWVDVLPLIDPAIDKFVVPNLTDKNDWRMDNGELVYRRDPDVSKGGKILFPIKYSQPDIEWEIEFTRTSGGTGINSDAPAAGGVVPIMVDENSSGAVLIGVKSERIGSAKIETGKRMKYRYRSLIDPLGRAISVFVDDKPVGEWKGEVATIVKPTNEAFDSASRNGVWVHRGADVTFHKIRARALNGGTIETIRPVADEPSSTFTAGAEWIDVLPLIDVKQDKFNLPGLTGINDWRMVRGELEYLGDSKNGKLLWPITLLGPAMEFEVEFTRRAGSQGFNLDIPAAAGPCPIVFDTNKRGKVLVGHTGIELPGDFMIVNDQRITVGVKITRQETVDLVQVTWDGSLLGTWRGDRESIAANKQGGYRHDRHQGFWIPGPQQFIFHKIRARPLQGGSIEPTRRPSGAPAATATPSPANTTPLFNGTNLAGWTGKPGVWKWEAGELVGTLNEKDVTYLSGSNPYRDFELEYEVKLQGSQANAGAQFRSTLFDAAPFAMTGPQAEIGRGGKTGYGGLWWQSGPRNGVLSASDPAIVDRLVKPDDYNRMTVRCVGRHVTITLNGTTTTDGDFDLPTEGVLGWQLVSQGAPASVRFRNIVFRDLSSGAGTSAAPAGPPLDLLAAIQIPRDVVSGAWQKQGAMLSTTGGTNIGTGHHLLYLPTPGPVPAEYDFELEVERKSNSGTGMVVGFVMGGKQATAMIDSYGPSDHWGIDEIDGETLRGNANPTKNVRRRLVLNRPTKVRVEVHKNGVRVFCAEEKVVDWQGLPEQLSTTFWKVPDPQALFLGSQSTFHIHSIRLTPR